METDARMQRETETATSNRPNPVIRSHRRQTHPHYPASHTVRARPLEGETEAVGIAGMSADQTSGGGGAIAGAVTVGPAAGPYHCYSPYCW